MNDRRLVAFLSGGQGYAVPISEVAEVIDAAGVEVVPGCVHPLEGLMVHRGAQILPVFSLPGAGQGALAHAGRLVMVVRTMTGQVGFRLEKVLGVLPLPVEGQEALSPDMPPGLRAVARGGLPFKGGILVVLDTAKALMPAPTGGG